MTHTAEDAGQSGAPSGAGGETGGSGELSDADLLHLVDKVYRLFQSELRLARVRGEPLPGKSGPVGRRLC